jgi:hypothetical protein
MGGDDCRHLCHLLLDQRAYAHRCFWRLFADSLVKYFHTFHDRDWRLPSSDRSYYRTQVVNDLNLSWRLVDSRSIHFLSGSPFAQNIPFVSSSTRAYGHLKIQRDFWLRVKPKSLLPRLRTDYKFDCFGWSLTSAVL